MIAFCTIFLMFAQAPPATLDQVRSDANPEHRARVAVEFAAMAERNAEAAYSRGEPQAVSAELQHMVDAVELARKSLEESGKSPMRHPGPYKSAELRTQEILVRLGDLERKMDSDERGVVEGPKAKVQDIHDAWFDGIMSRKRK